MSRQFIGVVYVEERRFFSGDSSMDRIIDFVTGFFKKVLSEIAEKTAKQIALGLIGAVALLVLCVRGCNNPTVNIENRNTITNNNGQGRPESVLSAGERLVDTPIIKLPSQIVQDSHGNRARFQVYVFEKNHNWRKNAYTVEFSNMPVDESKMIFYLSKIHGDMKTADALVCVGTASAEGDEKTEETRAAKRAEWLIIWTRQALQEAVKSPELYTLNLGHYRESL
jgi:hypothetical protein